MRRVDLGFFIFMTTVFLAPEIAIAETTASLGIVGILAWALLGGLDLPLAKVTREPWFLAAALFGTWALTVSIHSVLACGYALQQLAYMVFGGMMMRAYAARRPERFWQITGILTGLYATALLISWWTGPFYPWQMGFYVRELSEDLVRATGTSSSVNQAGGVAAVFCLLMIGQGRRWLVILCLVALVLTFSRSAVLSFAFGVTVLAAHWFLGGRERRALAIVLALTVSGCAVIILVPQSAGFDIITGATDIEYRSQLWARGIRRWQDGTVLAQLVGEGFHTSPGTTSHNLYLELLGDLGLIGLLFFVVFAGTSLWSTRFSAASSAGLVTLLAHNSTEVFLYHPSIAVTWLLCLAGAQRPRRLAPTASVEELRLDESTGAARRAINQLPRGDVRTPER